MFFWPSEHRDSSEKKHKDREKERVKHREDSTERHKEKKREDKVRPFLGFSDFFLCLVFFIAIVIYLFIYCLLALPARSSEPNHSRVTVRYRVAVLFLILWGICAYLLYLCVH